MKKIIFLACAIWASIASAQFVPNQILTASQLNNQFALYAPLAGPANFVTQGFLDNSTLAATDAFVKRTVLAATAEIPIANVTGGTYNFASVGTGAQLVVFVSGGAISSVLTIAMPGT